VEVVSLDYNEQKPPTTEVKNDFNGAEEVARIMSSPL